LMDGLGLLMAGHNFLPRIGGYCHA
jgi:hypothetical protein